MVLGIILYSYKQLAGYSFILMIIAGFFYFTGVMLVLLGGWQISLRAGAPTEEGANKKAAAPTAAASKDEAL